MSKSILIRFGGLAAILAGVLRGIASFVPATASDTALQLLYFFTDVFIVLGIVALYGMSYGETGKSGFFGFLIAIVGIVIVRSARAIPGMNLYSAGALVFSVGLNFLGISLWKANRIPGWVAACWILSILAGFIVYLLPGLSLLFPVAGILFSVGLIGAGFRFWSTAA